LRRSVGAQVNIFCVFAGLSLKVSRFYSGRRQ
jgi:hypothetical protein